MRVTKKQIDDLNVELTVSIAAEDYAPAEKKKLNELKRNADIKGFRKGMAPMSLIQKFYGEDVLVNVINDIVSDKINGYIKKNELRVIGEPLGSDKQPDIEWKSGNDFKFVFDLGLAPEVKIDVVKEDTVPYYTIMATAEGKEEMRKNLLMQYGGLEEIETPTAEAYVYLDLKQGDKTIENAYVSMRDLTEAYKTAFLGYKAGSEFIFNVNDAFESEADRAAVLKVKKEELAGMDPVYNATVVNIKAFSPAEATPETFDKIYGEGVIKTEEEFEAQIAKDLAANYTQEADYRVTKDIRNYFVEKANLTLPEEFLRRWLFAVNKKNMTIDQIAEEFPGFVEDYKWQLVRAFLMEKYDIKITEKDVEEAAMAFASYQYAMYGMANVPEEYLKDAAQRIMADERQVSRLEEQVEDQKVFAAIKPEITLKKKKISLEKFRELK